MKFISTSKNLNNFYFVPTLCSVKSKLLYLPDIFSPNSFLSFCCFADSFGSVGFSGFTLVRPEARNMYKNKDDLLLPRQNHLKKYAMIFYKWLTWLASWCSRLGICYIDYHDGDENAKNPGVSIIGIKFGSNIFCKILINFGICR